MKILPFFGRKRMCDIIAADVRQWQNKLMRQNFSQTYLKSINNQLSAIFNYAVRYYDLPKNPCTQAGSIGKRDAKEMQFWTQEEFEAFIEAVRDKPLSYYAFARYPPQSCVSAYIKTWRTAEVSSRQTWT